MAKKKPAKRARPSNRLLEESIEKEAERVSKKKKKAAEGAQAKAGLLMQHFEQFATSAFAKKMTAATYKTSSRARGDKRILNLLLSDLHFGALMDGSETPQAYSAEIESRRFARVLGETANYKNQHRDQTKLHVYVMGDIIEGILHDPADAEPLAVQFTIAAHLFTQAFGYLCSHFPEVEVWWQTGNHERNPMRHPQRAMSYKWDSYATMICEAVRLATAGIKNLKIHAPRTPYAAVEVFGEWIFATHGDTHLSFGNPGKAIAVSKISAQMNSVNSSMKYGKRFSLFCGGHVHQPLLMPLDAGVLVVNGALVPENGYADALGYTSVCGQWLWESVPGYIVGDSRLIRVGETDDKDASLNKIIRPVRL